MSIFAFLPLWTSQMSIQTMAMSDLGETLITLGFDASEMLSKMWFCLSPARPGKSQKEKDEKPVKKVPNGVGYGEDYRKVKAL